MACHNNSCGGMKKGNMRATGSQVPNMQTPPMSQQRMQQPMSPQMPSQMRMQQPMSSQQQPMPAPMSPQMPSQMRMQQPMSQQRMQQPMSSQPMPAPMSPQMPSQMRMQQPMQMPLSTVMPPSSSQMPSQMRMQQPADEAITSASRSPEASETPSTVENPYYTAGFLNQYIGRDMRVEYLIGTGGPLVDRVGRLVEVGADYIVLQPYLSDDLLMTDLFSIKFVTIFD